VIVDCDVLSHGADTVSLWLGQSGRYYHARCNFSGSVDFLCPRGWCQVTDCNFYEKFVLRHCKFDGANDWVLARHRADAQFFYLYCSFAETMTDQPPLRVIYPLSGEPTEADLKRNQELDKQNRRGDRAHFWNCHPEDGDWAWHRNKLSSAAGSPTPEQITAAWTFAFKWNPENSSGPTFRTLKQAPARLESCSMRTSPSKAGRDRLSATENLPITQRAVEATPSSSNFPKKRRSKWCRGFEWRSDHCLPGVC
jgi:pectinesterase